MNRDWVLDQVRIVTVDKINFNLWPHGEILSDRGRFGQEQKCSLKGGLSCRSVMLENLGVK